MENLVKYLISAVVGNDDFEVAIDESKPKLTVITITANEENVGKIIGRGGKTISSIRTIVRSASAKSGKKFIIKVNE